MHALILILFALLIASESVAQQLTTYSSSDAARAPIEVEATLTPPRDPLPAGSRGPAVVLFHSSGGWENPVTGQYAKALSEAGFTVLEPRLFRNDKSGIPRPPSILHMAYDALAFLADRDDVDARRVGIAGFSYGGQLALHAAAAWAQTAYARSPDLKFAAHAPFYPVCWAFTAFAQGKRKTPNVPDDAFTKWTGVPVRIFAGGKDYYDDQDPGACSAFVSQVPAEYRQAFSVRLYPEATHGWDQKSASFYERGACKGHGCWNHNEANPEVTRQGIRELVEFFTRTLGSPSGPNASPGQATAPR
jgi:uncharacterized protein